MENIPGIERQVSMTTFGVVTVAQQNKLTKRMATCKNCGFVLDISELAMWKHWKFECAYDLSFKYVYPKDTTDKTKVACLVCRKNFVTTSFAFMGTHRMQCGKNIQSNSVNSSQTADGTRLPMQSNNVNNLTPVATKTAPGSLLANKYTVSTTTTTSAVDLNQLQFDKFKFHYGDKIHYGTQCRICKNVWAHEDMLKLLHHRTQCKENNPQPLSETHDTNTQLDKEVLITVQTVHTPLQDTKNAGQSNFTAPATATPKFCFICNAPNNDSFVKMFGSESTYSKKPIYDYIWKFLGNKPSARNATADASNLNDEVLCSDCFGMICDYDESRSKTKRLKKQIRRKLAITETYFEQRQNAMDVTQPAERVGGNDQQEQQQPTGVITMANNTCEVIDLCDDD